MNYTEAASTCVGHRGYLAQVIGDERTNFLSFMIQKQVFDASKNMIIPPTDPDETKEPPPPVKIPVRHAFIGLREFRQKGNFVNSLDIPIKCYRYRAWAPRYPRLTN